MHYRGNFRYNKKYLKYSKSSATRFEKKFQEQLIRTETPFFTQYPFKYLKSFIMVDFYIPSSKLVFEIDGLYHNSDDQKNKDEWRDFYLNKKGIKVIRITNRAVQHWKVKRIKEQILKYKLDKRQLK